MGTIIQAIGILGVGELTEKVVLGLRRSGYRAEIFLSPRNHDRAARLSEAHGCRIMQTNQEVVERSSLLLLGVRPEAVPQLAEQVQLRPGQTLVSLVAGLKLDALAAYFPTATLARAMLSYAAQINQSTVVVTPAGEACEALLGTLGTLVVLADEHQFELATVAACMNGWFYFFLDGLQRWFVAQGLPREQARQLVLGNMQDCLASARLQPQQRLEALGRAIATPGTFTATGLGVLGNAGATDAWHQACDAVLEGLLKSS